MSKEINPIEEMNKKWKKDFDRLEAKIELLRISCVVQKKSHSYFKKERRRLFGKEIDRLFKQRFLIGALGFEKTLRDNKEVKLI